MKIPILNGVYTDKQADFRTSYPRNLITITKNNGISSGYLRPADGIIKFGEGPGIDRGGINWKGICYRVMGQKFVSINSLGSITIIGDVGGIGEVSLTYSFDYLAIVSGGNVFLFNPQNGIRQIIDKNLGDVIDAEWIAGYFVFTDGVSLIVTELNDPFSIDPLKYGASEFNPDNITALQELDNEMYVLNRITIEVFQVVGTTGFPLQTIAGAQVQRGCVGPRGCCVFMEQVFFVGNGFNEQVSIYVLAKSRSTSIATEEIDLILNQYSEEQLASVICEGRVGRGYSHLWIRLPDRTLVYDYGSSIRLQEPVWFILNSSIDSLGAYRAKNLVWCYNKWLVGDCLSQNIGYLSSDISSQYGDLITWEFGTTIIYNKGLGATFNQLELICLPGRTEFGKDPIISTEYSYDGINWNQPMSIRCGKDGNYNKRIVWFKQGSMRNFRIQKFTGTSDSFVSFAGLEATLEPLNA